jgi:predicted P-loop ATPase
MQGILIVEVAELHAFQKKDPDAIKSWLSRQTDRYRPVYGKLAIDVPRKWVIAGTLNPAGSGYLRDPTGARRFWPIPVKHTIDIARVEAERDQIWAEAVHLYEMGHPWHLTEEEMIQAGEVTEDRYEDDPWDGLIDEFIRGHDRFTMQEVIRALAIPVAQQTQITSRRIGRHLRHRGWEKRLARIGQGRDYVWTRRE